MAKVLVTGFDPFGGELSNPSWEAVRQLDGQAIEGFEIVSRQLPTVFGRAMDVLREAVLAENPAAILCVGQAGGRPDITIERVGINVDDARIQDNKGQQPVDQEIVNGGPVAYWSTLPIKGIVKEIRALGIPASVSNTAGTFVCNHILYGLRYFLEEQQMNIPAGFIHIPYLPEQGVAQQGQPTMSKETVVRALKTAIAVTVRAL
ncbi:MAG: pyroglutamyl-peptidase I [Desulfitobacteriaceae bacterium]